jgi:hypothetical protein
LNYFIEKAKQNSPLIQKNNADKKLFELDFQQTERILKSPNINLESNILFAPIISHDNNINRFELTSSGATNYTGYDLGISNGGQFQAFVSVNQPLFTGSRMKTYASKKNISGRIADNSTTMTIHEIEQLVGYQYILCLKSKLQIENNNSNRNQLNEQLELLQKLVQHAVYKETDLLLLQIESQNLELENKSLTDEFRSNLYDLNLLCGINEPIHEDILPLEQTLKPDTIVNSAFLNSYKLDSLNLINDFMLTELKYKPQLSAFANAGMNAVYIPGFNRLGFSAGLTFMWNLYDGNQRKIERERSNVNIQSLQFEKNNFMTQKEINKNKIVSQMKAIDEQMFLLDNQLNKYSTLFETYKKELSQGLISIMDYKNLLKDVTAKKQEKTLALMQKQFLINSYNYWNY